mmetsp:Transcript_19503/g.29339  ORF Transcript_19503/g.29339 Transcript_19503/m.29339 type:complete len:835 (+) Transcript_19503:161-2665(+)|eukprot:CAMPEP_0178924786 /NCGR_PEP_ID=MMETSP0786-20121207/17522_1 /TAXON_ID=186022 /ORGANISM="Thalassionema frauenfeldii, Strain CCMP 1798" /LENGTH=834 /DNA_ID=CAMNT_0020599539 /DNA_START=61 /DNA_END=2565 /DNA_ORIENTATION=+
MESSKSFSNAGNESAEGDTEMPDASQSSIPESIALDEERSAVAASHTFLPPVPERTLKEKLVERERQKRIETERARLKRQFALSNDMMVEDDDQGTEAVEGDLHNHTKDGSLAGTVGEGSSVAVVREEDEKSEKLGYAMERFLSEQGQEKMVVDATSTSGDVEGMLKKEDAGGVVMERFLSEPVVVVPPSDVADDEPPSSGDNVVGQMVVMENEEKAEMHVDNATESVEAAATVTFEATIPTASETLAKLQPRDGGDSEVDATAGSVSYVSSVGDEDITTEMNSIDADAHSNVAQLDDLERLTEPDSPSLETSLSNTSTEQGPRFLRLTEREIQEMAAIEEASIGNAPPSEREDTLSEVGDLVGSFTGGRDFLHSETGGFSVQTHTTASVSNTSAGGNQSGGGQSREASADQHSIDSVSVSSHLVLSPGGSEAGVSVAANPPSVIPNDEEEEEEPDPSSIIPPNEVLATTTSPTDLPNMPNFQDNMGINVDNGDPLSMGDVEASALHNEGIINRRLRPGIRTSPDCQPEEITNSNDNMNDFKRTQSMPDIMHPTVDGFDFDKNIPTTPRSNANDSYRDLPGSDTNNSHSMSGTRWSHDENSVNVSPLLIPRFRSRDEIEKHQDQNIQPFLSEMGDSKKFDVIDRVLPERFHALVKTLIMEIPVLLIISCGSDSLYLLIGEKKYQLLMGFLPLSNAIAGNCVLQAKDLATGAIHHRNSKKESAVIILTKELKATTLLGLGMGIALGVIAFVLSGFDLPFSLSICFAQFLSIVVGGLTGSCIPLLLHRNDSSTWCIFFQTVIPDMVGSLAMVLLSYHFLIFSGCSEVGQSCRVSDA